MKCIYLNDIKKAGINLAYISTGCIVERTTVKEVQTCCNNNDVSRMKGQCFYLRTVEEIRNLGYNNIVDLFKGKVITESKGYLVVIDNGNNDSECAAKVLMFYSDYLAYHKDNPNYIILNAGVNEITFSFSRDAVALYNEQVKLMDKLNKSDVIVAFEGE